ncbi:MAG: immunoglobulin domain-containing protein [Lentisphaerota bacterium]
MKKIKSISTIFVAVASFLLALSVNAGTALTAKYAYDANSCLTKVVYSGGATSDDRTINFTYDNNGNLTNVSAVGGKVDLIIINTQPVYTPVEVGGIITLSISATGDGIHTLNYQWRFLPDGGTWGDIGGNSPILQLAGLTPGNQGYYKCIVSDGINSPLNSAAVKVYVLDPGISDLWSSTTYLAPGSRFSIYDFEVPTIPSDLSFTAKPKLLKGELVQAVAGKTVTYALTLLTSPTILSPKDTLSCVWPTAVLLYDKTKLTSSYASGFYCADFLGLYPQYDKDTFIVIQTAAGAAQYLSRFFTLTPPEITDVMDKDGAGAVSISSAGVSDKIFVLGNFFGKKAPTAWLEYKISGKPGVSKLLLKVIPPLAYPDEKNVPAKSCMSLDSGESKIQVQIPATLPAGIIKGNNNIVIDNGQGLATFAFRLE